MIIYESMIDDLETNSQLEFYEMSIESLSLNEGLDVKGKFSSMKEAVLKFFRNIREKISSFISMIKEKLTNKKAKEKANKIEGKLNGKDGEKIAKAVGAKYKTGDKSLEKGGSEVKGAAIIGGSIVKFAEFGISYHPLNVDNINNALSKQNKGIDFIEEIRNNFANSNKGNPETYSDAYSKFIGSNEESIKASFISDREIKVTNITAATLNSIADEISVAQQSLDKSEKVVSTFDKVCMKTQKYIDSVKVDDDASLASFKKSSTKAINATRVVFDSITKCIKSLSQYITVMYGVLDRIDAVCTTYNVTDDSIR